ncbi:MAG: DUF480 domain-containing protein [Chromatiales bacterium]|jgi:uncharacterized protein YceH (UPF0502 family)
MDLVLDEHEARVVGSLLEKEITTPDQYPLSLNALTNACNQKSNRDPVMSLDEAQVLAALDSLRGKHLILEKSGFGSRVPKYQHRFCNTQFGTLQFSEQEFGLVCVLLLRGPQTPGELRSRTQRLCRFSDVGEVEACLEALADRDDGPFVVRLAREPGKRESRYAHLFSGEVQSGAAATSAAADPDHSPSLGARVYRLEQQVADLAEQLGRLRKSLGED